MNNKYNTEHLEYNHTNAYDIFDYSKGLLDKTLRDFIKNDYKKLRGKGQIGQMVENLYFHLNTNCNPAADFPKAQLELKCTPLKRSKTDEYLIKERLACNMINYCKVVEEDFYHSHFYLKCQLMLLLFYLYEKGKNIIDFKFIFSVLWILPHKDLLIIKQDYDIIIDKIKNGKAHLLSEGDTMYLGACRKGKKNDKLTEQPFSNINAPKRAFCLKKAYMRTILKYVSKSKQNAVTNLKTYKQQQQLITSKTLTKNRFDDIILQRLIPYMGMHYEVIGKQKKLNFSKNPKNKFSMIANALISKGMCSNVNRSEEFLKAGLTMKTIRVQANGHIKEAMSFENIDYLEIAECENWYDSRLYELFSSRFIFVIFKEQTKGKNDYILSDAFFWTMPQDDLKWAEQYWKHIRNNVLEEHLSEEYWWKGADRKKFHVRPKGQKAADLAPTINGKKAKKFCYWFNNDYIRYIVDNRQKENGEKR